MIRSTPINDKKEQEQICETCNIKYEPDHLAYKIEIGGKLCGILTFKISGTNGIICEMATLPETGDNDALFITCRGALNFLDLHGIHDAYFASEKVTAENEELIRKIGFTRNENGEWYMNLRGFFSADTCKNSCRNN